jgi:hypothetical protein
MVEAYVHGLIGNTPIQASLVAQREFAISTKKKVNSLSRRFDLRRDIVYMQPPWELVVDDDPYRLGTSRESAAV